METGAAGSSSLSAVTALMEVLVGLVKHASQAQAQAVETLLNSALEVVREGSTIDLLA